jgi:hypothetical protein
MPAIQVAAYGLVARNQANRPGDHRHRQALKDAVRRQRHLGPSPPAFEEAAIGRELDAMADPAATERPLARADLWSGIVFTLVGLAFAIEAWRMPRLVLGVILGDILDKNLRRALTLSDGDLTPFFTRPISAVLWVVTLLLVLGAIPVVRRAVARRFAGAAHG